MNAKDAKKLVGRRITEVRMNGAWEGGGGGGYGRVYMHNPVIVLDDGTELVFVVEEHPDGGEYGVDIVRRKAAAKPTR